MKLRILSTLSIVALVLLSCVDDSFMADKTQSDYSAPANLKYMKINNAREGKAISSSVPTVDSDGLVASYEIVSGRKADGTVLDESYMKYVSIANYDSVLVNLDESYENKVDENGDTLTSFVTIDTSNSGRISIVNGNNFTVGDYFFTVKVSTEYEGKQFTTVFNDAFALTVEPLLANYLIFSPKNQNLIYGQENSKTTAPLLPSANKDVTFSLGSHTDKLQINSTNGEVSLLPTYTYNGYDTIIPTIIVRNNISNEEVEFKNSLIAIVTDKAEEMPQDVIYPFYPTLKTSGSKPTGGEGFAVQVDMPGNSEDIWGEVDNSNGRYLTRPAERPAQNTTQTVLEAQTFSGSNTKPTQSWCVTTTQDLSPFQYGYDLSVNYYYNPSFQIYMSDGRTPTDLEVYISTDYNGGDIQDAEGNWKNGTWTKVNDIITCQIGSGKVSGKPSGAPWGTAFVGTPYPGNNNGADPDGRKVPGRDVYGRWIKCSLDISEYNTCTSFTVAFKVASYFTGQLINKAPAVGRGGTYFLSDFHYKATEQK